MIDRSRMAGLAFRIGLGLALMLMATEPVRIEAQSPSVARADTTSRNVTLAEALAFGRRNAFGARLARMAAQGTELRSREQRGALLPSIDGSATVQRQRLNLREFGLSIPGFPAVTDPFTLFRARLGATQVLFDATLFERLRAARDTAIAAGLDADQAGELGAALAGAAWLQLAGAEATLAARQQDSITAFALLDIARDRVAAGTAARIEQTRSETEAAAVRIEIAVAHNARDRARLDLALATGLPLGAALDATDAMVIADSIPANLEQALATASAHRLDLAAERQRQQVLHDRLTANQRAWLPSLAASGFVQSSGNDLNDMAGTWNIGIGLAWPLFDGFARRRRIDETELRVAAGERRLHDLEQRIEAEVRQAELDLESARAQVMLATDRVRLAEEELDEAQQRFAAGVAGSVETTTAQGAVAAARDALIRARIAQGAARVSGLKALGLLGRVQ